MELQSPPLHSSVDAAFTGGAAQNRLVSSILLDPSSQERSTNVDELLLARAGKVSRQNAVEQLAVGSEAAAAVYDRVGASSEQSEVGSSAEMVSRARAAKLESEQAELQVTRELAARDREVKTHEQTHAAVGAPYTSSPSYTYTNGPDGRLYATGGEVSIDTSPVENDPQATLEKAQVIIRAALSVAEPSNADRQAAAEAKSLALQARAELQSGEQREHVEAEPVEEKVSGALAQEQLNREEDVLKREELLEQQSQKQESAERDERDQEVRRERAQASVEVLREYNVKVSEIQETLRRLNLQLVDSGAFKKLFPEGFLIDKSV
ncbi:MAG: putative metalloprotease CJM1_0395 family protein [Pseudomonadales bacterium]